jgi:hypothetical protein
MAVAFHTQQAKDRPMDPLPEAGTSSFFAKRVDDLILVAMTLHPTPWRIEFGQDVDAIMANDGDAVEHGPRIVAADGVIVATAHDYIIEEAFEHSRMVYDDHREPDWPPFSPHAEAMAT